MLHFADRSTVVNTGAYMYISYSDVAATELRHAKCSKYCDNITQVFFKTQNLTV